MIEGREVPWPGKSGKDARDDDRGIRAIYTSEDDKSHQADGEAKMIIDACFSLQTDAMILELIDHALVVAANCYDGTYAVAICDQDANLAYIARGLQIRIYCQPESRSSNTFLPVATVRSALGRWERQIAVVFGRQYASSLTARNAATKTPDRMTRDDIENLRRQLSSAIGGCIDLQKVDK